MSEASAVDSLPAGGIGLVAGWSYPATVFEPLRRRLGEASLFAYDWTGFVDGWLGEWAVSDAPRPRIWVGWSLGGALLLEALRRGRIAPERLILVNATPRFLEAPGWPGVRESEWRGLRQAAGRHPEAAVAAFRRRFALPDVPGGAGNVADVGGLDWLARLDLRGFLSEVSAPVECWLAPEDPLVPVDWPSRLALSPLVSCHRFFRSGHAAWWHAPAELADRISAL